MTPPDSSSGRWRAALARVLAAGYRDCDDARAFIAEALDDEMSRGRCVGVMRISAHCLKDLIVTQWRPSGLPITAAPISTHGGSSTPLRSSLMEQIIQDIRYGVRQLLHQPGFALAAILTMALGIGGNTAIFNVAWQALLKPLPYPDSGRLVEVWETVTRNNAHNYSMPGKFRDLQRESRSLATVAAYTGLRRTTDLTEAGDPEQLDLRAVTADYFKVFGMNPLAGRTLGADDITGDQSAVVISEGLWLRRFGGRRDIVGAPIRLNGRAATVVGVMPAAFEVEGGRVDVWTPLQLPPDEPRLAAHFLRVVGRLAPGVPPAQADAEIKAIANRAAAAFPSSDGSLTQQVEVIASARRAASLGDGLFLLSLAAAAVLLIACANLAGLQLARGVARQREFGIRAALGATRWRIVTQLLTEGLVISLLGAVAGVFIGIWALQVLAAVAPPTVSVAARTWPDLIVITYAATLAIGSAVVFSLAPSWRTANSATLWLRQRAETADGRSAIIRLALVAGQIGVAVTLLISATLLVSSLARVMRVDPGFQPDGALTFDASVPARVKTYAQQRQLFDGIAGAVAALHGVTSVCAINEIPLDAEGGMTYVAEGETRMIGAAPRNVTAGCFDALGLRLSRGRPFTAHEQTRVAIVSESFARAAWPRQDPIGKRVHQGVPTGELMEVVGVVADALQNSLEMRAFPQLYEAWTEPSAFWPSRFVVRATVPPQSLFDGLRIAVRRVDPDQTVARLRTLNDVVGKSVAGRQFDLRLLGSFSVVAIVLAAIGVYGLLSQLVAQRTREIGVRLALGATPNSVVRLMLKSAAIALLAGLPLGLGGALLVSRLLRRFMFKLSPTDPAIYAAVSAALVVIVMIAAWLPARRAARVDPALTLR
jgi:putative ABC transport system permease protein